MRDLDRGEQALRPAAPRDPLVAESPGEQDTPVIDRHGDGQGGFAAGQLLSQPARGHAGADRHAGEALPLVRKVALQVPQHPPAVGVGKTRL